MPEYTRHQKKIIERYYGQRDTIMLTRLQELVTELYLADSETKRDRLWKRAETAMQKSGVTPALIAHIISSRSPETLAKNVRDWTTKPPDTSNKQ